MQINTNMAQTWQISTSHLTPDSSRQNGTWLGKKYSLKEKIYTFSDVDPYYQNWGSAMRGINISSDYLPPNTIQMGF